MRATADCCGDGAGGRGVAAGGLASRVERELGAMVHRTPRRGLGDFTLAAGSGPQTGLPALFLSCGLRATAKFGPRARSIREKIIGRSERSQDSRAGVACSRSSINQRASMAAVFSSSQESSN